MTKKEFCTWCDGVLKAIETIYGADSIEEVPNYQYACAMLTSYQCGEYNGVKASRQDVRNAINLLLNLLTIS